ncbi:MAG: Wzy polymerase domain-containing protein [Burkholderiales bacterium]|nr:Wzy polymerase domain-containing protein [Burkholderiales bacterium]
MINSKSAFVSFILFLLLFTVPFLSPGSYFPVGKFYAEGFSLIIAFAIGVFFIIQSERIKISSITIACVLFAAYLLLQVVVLPIRVPGINYLVALQVMIGAIISLGATSFINSHEENQKILMQQLAWAAVIGTTIQAVFGLMQYTGLAENFRSVILFAGNTEVIGNIGQKNDYVDFITIGVFALAYLFFIRKVNLAVFVVWEIFYSFILTVSTSRVPFLFFIVAFVIVLTYYLKHKNSQEKQVINKQILYTMVGLFVIFFILELIVPKIAQLFSGSVASTTSGLYRFQDNAIGQSTYRRFYEWYKDIIIFIQHPIFGIGWHQYIREALYLMNTDRFMYIPANSALYTHSHNTPLNILAETGIIGFFITMIYGFGYSIYRMFKNFNNHATLFLVLMVMTIFVQGCFQYPLWYAYFLIYFILFLSFDKPILTYNNSKLIKGLSVIVFAGFIGFFVNNVIIYNNLTVLATVPHDIDDYTANTHKLEEIIQNNPMWVEPALIVMDSYIIPGSDRTNAAMNLREQLYFEDQVGNDLPYPSAIFKQIILHKMAGDNAGALAYSNLLAHAFPYFKDQFAQQLASSPYFSDDVAAINNFKYEDKSIFTRIFKKN